MDRIVLNVTAGGWVARHEGSIAADVWRLFGTDTIPTPFTLRTSAERVLATIKELNPGVVVVLG
jgi:hypothetical protein